MKSLIENSTNVFRNSEKSKQKKFNYAYSGSFDLWTKGHLAPVISFLSKDPDANVDIIIGKNQDKSGMFSFEDRRFIIQKSLPAEYEDRIRISIISGVIANYMYRQGIPYFIKGARGTADYQYESDLAKINSELYGSPMTLIIPQTDQKLSNVSSSNLKMLGNIGVSLDKYASAYVREALKMKTSGKLLIGVSGGIASGKSTVSSQLSDYSKDKDVKIHHIDMDKLTNEILSDPNSTPLYLNVRNQIAAEFGQEVMNTDGTINRKALGDIIFVEKDKVDKLTNITLEPTLFLMSEQINSLERGIILIESAMFVSRNLTELVDENIINVNLNPHIQLERMQEIRGFTKD